MPEPPKKPSETKAPKFDEILAHSRAYEPSTPEAPPVELIGRIRKSDEAGKFVLLIPAAPGQMEYAVEIKAADVQEHRTVFEDSSGEKSYAVKLPPTAAVRLVVQAAGFSGTQIGQKTFDPKPWDPKIYDPKHFDPKITDPKRFEPKIFDPKIFDPKPDPKGDPSPGPGPGPGPLPQKLDPKHTEPKVFDPKTHDPKVHDPKYSDPKYTDPKQFDPKPDPKGDPGPGPGPFGAAAPQAVPHAAQAQYKYFDPKYWDPKYWDPKYWDPKHHDPKLFEASQMNPGAGQVGPFVLTTPWGY